MTEAIHALEPKSFWRCFAEISAIPRPSGHEERVARYVMDRARQLGLETHRDALGNVLVRKAASPGREGAPGICLQSHLDMVCEKNADKVHDFLNDPIVLVVGEDVVTADGTTLGADNGVGVATSLAVMEDPALEHGPLEFLFTVEEETGLTGAKNLDPAFVRSRTLLNLDSEEEGALYIGCAGGRDTVGSWRVEREAAPAGFLPARVTVKGLKGGHSGLEIDKGLGNAIKLLNRVLARLAPLGARLATVEGGKMRNAIPRECRALLYLPAESSAEAAAVVREQGETFRFELGSLDPGVEALLEWPEQENAQVMDQAAQRRLTRAIAALPSGVQRMSTDIPGLVETSTNVSVISSTEEGVVLVTSQRSSSASRLDEVVGTVSAVFELAGAQVEVSEGYPGWRPNLESPILKLGQKCHRDLFGRNPEVKAIHAGLECGIIGERIPGMDMVSFGPDMAQVHSPEERVYIKSVEKYWKLVLAILKAA